MTFHLSKLFKGRLDTNAWNCMPFPCNLVAIYSHLWYRLKLLLSVIVS